MLNKTAHFEPHFLQYWNDVKDVVDENGWVYNKDVHHLLDAYFEYNTGKNIEFQKSWQFEGKSDSNYRWRPSSITG